MLDKLEAYYKNLALDHESKGRTIEALTCGVYTVIIKECKAKHKRGKHEDFIRRGYEEAYKKIRQLGEDFPEDSFIQSVRKNAFMIIWQMLGYKRNDLHIFAYKHRVYLPDLT